MTGHVLDADGKVTPPCRRHRKDEWSIRDRHFSRCREDHVFPLPLIYIYDSMTHMWNVTIHSAILLIFAGVLGGAINAVAGGGSFFTFPALLATGVPPIPANATSTVALWLGITASGGAYRNRLDVSRRMMIPLIVTSVIGGFAGALLLVHTPAETFLRVLPWLMLSATLLFAFGRQVSRRFSSGLARDASTAAVAGAAIFELVVAVYGGYFGGGIGIVNLAMLAALGMTDIHAMNAMKVILSGVINGAAVITFIVLRAVHWGPALVTTVGAVAGGYFAARYAQRLPQSWIRGFVIVVGIGMTAYFFVKAH